MAELRTLEMGRNGRAERATIWLSLNLLVSMRNDESCFAALSDGGLLNKLKIDMLATTSDDSSSRQSTPEQRGTDELSPLDHLYLLANRAQTFGMQSTAKQLFILCADEMARNQKTSIMNENNTIGFIQRNIINLASEVVEVVTTFDSIDRVMKLQNKPDHNDSMTYSLEDIDYFVVEAHNRACSLTFVGDALNAEKLLTVALNLLPHSSKEVESYGSEIRRTYRGVIGRRGVGGGALASSAGDLVTLFEG